MAEILTENVHIPDGQPGFQFYHNGVEFIMWMWLQDQSDDCQQLNLSEVVNNRFGEPSAVVKAVVVLDAWYRPVADAGGVRALMRDVWLPKVNAYLATVPEVGEVAPLGDYPIDGIDKDKFNFLITGMVTYSEGKLHLTE